MNIFKGARRLAGAIAIVAFLIAIATFPQDNKVVPYGEIIIESNKRELIFKIETYCHTGQEEEVWVTTMNGTKAHLCVPSYKEQQKQSQTQNKKNDEFENAVYKAIKKLKKDPSAISQESTIWLDDTRRNNMESKIQNHIIHNIVGLLSFWVVVWLIGWIVRGFFDIPSGKDHRCETCKPAGEISHAPPPGNSS